MRFQVDLTDLGSFQGAGGWLLWDVSVLQVPGLQIAEAVRRFLALQLRI